MPLLPVPVLKCNILSDLTSKMKERQPIVIREWDIGPCVHKWTSEYLFKEIGNDPVKIHVSHNGKMDFLQKNFLYKTLPFNELIKRIFCIRQQNFFIHPEEFYYLRSIGSDPRGKNAANFLEQCQHLAVDLKVPQLFNKTDFFSSVFRASSQGLQLWTHYDIMDNLLIQIRGEKKITLWPPSEINKLYLKGDKSQVIDIEKPDLIRYPKFEKAIRYESILYPGDFVFIPALWFHNTTAITPCIGVNIFWKNLSHDLYDKNDSYGNKDLLPAAKGLRTVESTIASLNILPKEYKNFYIRRMIAALKDALTSENYEKLNEDELNKEKNLKSILK